MKAHEALIAWTPADWSHNETRGTVRVGKLISDPHDDWTVAFGYTGGADETERRDWRGDKSIARVFIEFHTLVVRDGIAPEEAHQAFLAIDEYAENISTNIPGARSG